MSIDWRKQNVFFSAFVKVIANVQANLTKYYCFFIRDINTNIFVSQKNEDE